jgi:hypothetical protein
MLNHLTTYLFHYKKVSIPYVGTIQIVQRPPQLDVVGKIIQPPSYLVEFRKEEEITDHQIRFLDDVLKKGKENVQRDLRFFGDKLQEKINGPGFEWEGLGTVNRSTQSIPLQIGALEAVPAQKVIRQDADHKVLVGDQHMTSTQIAELRSGNELARRKRSIYVIIGWIMLVLSILFIAIYLYLGKFRVSSTGSKVAPSGYIILPNKQV